MQIENVVAPVIAAAVGGGVGYALYRLKERALRAESVSRERDLAESLRRDTEAARLEARLAAREELARDRAADESALRERRDALNAVEQRLADREAALARQLDRVGERERELAQQGAALDRRREDLEKSEADVARLGVERQRRLEEVAQLNSVEARTQLLREVEQACSKDSAELARHIVDNARQNAEAEARRIIATAIQRYAGRHTFETVTATVALSGDDMKGRIIGRDGRNIRAFESATGVTVLVDDTPNAVVLSGFDPVRREVARQAMERLVLDGRIHPTRIEEVVTAVNQEMEAFILQRGEEAVYRAGQPPMDAEVAAMLGRLHFRHSFSQNVLQHSLEVAHLCGLMASELGEDPAIARRCGLLHDIGKAMSHEVEGPHALVGADFIKARGEGPVVVNAVASHHEEVPHENLFGVLVAAADAISASRPGGRSETMTTYLKRLENLEQIALDQPGVEKAFAVQAGRELRVVVRPEQVDDAASLRMARDIARRVEEVLLYPGQIRITVVRETRCVEYAK